MALHNLRKHNTHLLYWYLYICISCIYKLWWVKQNVLNKISPFIVMKDWKVEDKIKEWNLVQGGKKKIF